MNRRVIISLHLYLAAFFAPVLLIMAISGLLYLMDIKGSVESTQIYSGEAKQLSLGADNAAEQIEQWLEQNNIDHSFDYLRGNDRRAVTRPTSKTHYLFSIEDNQLTVTQREPDLIYTIIELHKGHGPIWFRYFQHLMAVGLLFIVLSGFWLGISSPALKKPTWAVTGGGLAVFLVLAML